MKRLSTLVHKKIALTKSVFSLILILSATFVFAQNGTIKGKILDANNKEPLIGAAAMIEGTSIGSASDFDGNYSISNLKPGKYTITSSYISYKPIAKENIIVEAGKETIVDLELESANINLKEVELVAKFNRESENILLLEQKHSLIATQAVGAKEMSRKGISNAEAAVAQVSGVSRQDGVKNVVIRGLGDRNNFTTLNGFPIPSEDPLYKNVSLDFFGSDIIKNVGVNKVFSSNNYSDVNGAIIDISSKELVGDKELGLDVSAGLNSQISGANFLKANGVNYWGISKNVQPGKSNYRTQYNYENSLDPHSVNLPLNSSYGFSGGKKYAIGEKKNPLSFYLVGSYSSSFSYSKRKIFDTQNDGTVIEDLDGKQSTQNINQLILGNVNFILNRKHQFNYNFLMLHDNTQKVQEYTGYNSEFVSSVQPDAYQYYGYVLKQKSNDNLLMANQLSTDFKLSDKTTLNAGISYNTVKGTEPDRRENNFFQKSDTEYQLLAGDGSHIRNFIELIENDLNGKIEFRYELPKKFSKDGSTLSVGYNGRYLTDDFRANEYSMIMTGLVGVSTIADMSLDNWFTQENYDNNKFVGAARISSFQVNKMINAGYAGLDYRFSENFSGNFGLRAEQINLSIDYNVQGGFNGDGSQSYNPFYILPSTNLKYNLTDKNAFRLGLSKTYTFPQSIELSPYQLDWDGFKIQGNPDLKPADNYNADLKWDYYLSPSELISLTGFYKYINNPIARVYAANSGGYLTYDNISNHASVAGVEVEIRKNIINKVNSNIEKVNKLTAGLNASYIYSNMLIKVGSDLPRNSALEGAAPYIANFDLTYEYSNKSISLVNSLVLNYISDKIFTIGFGGFIDIIEKGKPTLDFVSSYKINKYINLKLKAKNILDSTYELTRKATDGSANKTLRSYKKGMDLSLGFSYNF